MHTPCDLPQGLINEDQFERLKENALLATTSGIRASESDPAIPRPSPAWGLTPASAEGGSSQYMQTLQQSLARQQRLLQSTTRQVHTCRCNHVAVCSLAHSITDSHNYLRTHSLIHPLTHSLTHPPTHSLTHSINHSLNHFLI